MGQNVGTPRIYVDIPQYLVATGQHDFDDWFGDVDLNSGNPEKVIGLNPSSQSEFIAVSDGALSGAGYWTFKFNFGSQFAPQNSDGETNLYIAALGHNFASAGVYNYYGQWYNDENDKPNWTGLQEVLNNSNPVAYDGCSIKTYTSYATPYTHCRIHFRDDGLGNGLSEPVKLGSFSVGTYYDFPHSPDLNLTMTIENDGITTQQTKGGATLTNARYNGAPKWGDLGAWELLEKTSGAPDGTSWSRNARLGARTGRRSWNLTFSYLSDRNTLPVNALGGSLGDFDSLNDSNNGYTFGEDWYGQGIFGGGADDYISVLNGSDFFSSVWNKTMGGHLPFIFQPNKDNSNPDQFAIARFDMNSLQVKQVAYNTYTISLKIRECW